LPSKSIYLSRIISASESLSLVALFAVALRASPTAEITLLAAVSIPSKVAAVAVVLAAATVLTE
jgi:hypothetical protein